MQTASSQFVHLHVHTDFSMLDGACQVKKLAEKATELGMSAMGITDHGNMCGAIEFYNTMTTSGIKPIIGCELYIAPGSRFDHSRNHRYHKGYHLLLLAKNMEGYQNLCRLNSIAHTEGYYFKPRIDKEVLAQHAKGLIATSTCISGEISTHILEGKPSQADRSLKDYLDIFGRDHYYLELQNHGMKEQEQLNKTLVEFSKKYQLPLVATNDVHYLLKNHAHAHDVLLCIGTQKTLQDKNRLRFHSHEFYLKSDQEMAQCFAELPEALRNTLLIAEQCDLDLRLNQVNRYPLFTPLNGSTLTELLRRDCRQGLHERYDIELDHQEDKSQLSDQERAIIVRMEYELDIIEQMGFTSYFLVIADFLRFARERNIPIGPGRGSGSGSLVAYLLHITDIDPLRYQLLFERFLNPDRISIADFDIDICERRRHELIDYVRKCYGDDCVAQIGTFGTLKAKAALKDVARVLGHSFEEGNQLTKLVPNIPKITLQSAVEKSTELRKLKEKEAWVKEIFSYSLALEGLNRNMSIHAAGVIIGNEPLTNLIPLSRGQGNNEIVSQYSAASCEALGFVKIDFLGLRTLTIIQDTCDLVKAIHDISIDPGKISLDDDKSYDLLNQGDTLAIFQLESSGMRELSRKFDIHRIEDIIALIALFRPGPIQFIDDFIARKSGKIPVEYDLIELKPILEETYGIMLYQEQVMQVLQKVAGFSLIQADIFRRAMGKKIETAMTAEYEKFEQGCLNNAISPKTIKKVWDKILKFAGYGFNKSHSAAYAILAYQTAYLKAHHPVEFMAANLSNEIQSSDRIAILIHECRTMNITIKAPDINQSKLDFSVDNGGIRFGLAAIKGVGTATGEAILNARQQNSFTSYSDFFERIGSNLNRRVIECLCQCGAFDSLGVKRAQLFAMIDDYIQGSSLMIRDREIGQSNFFEILEEENADKDDIRFPDIPEWEKDKLLEHEKKLLGFYVTGHPLDTYSDMIKHYSPETVITLKKKSTRQTVQIAGIISNVIIKLSRKDNLPWAMFFLEDWEDSIECRILTKAYDKHRKIIQNNNIVFLKGEITCDNLEDSATILVSKVAPIQTISDHYTKSIHIQLDECKHNIKDLEKLKDILLRHSGNTPIVLNVNCVDNSFARIEPSSEYFISSNQTLHTILTDLLGSENVKIKVKSIQD